MDDTPPAGGKTAPPWQVLAALLQELPGLVSDRIHLLALELKRATQTLTRLIALVLAAAILGATAWIALWGAVVATLVEAGLGFGWACVIVLLVNLAAAGGALLQAKRIAPLLGLPATLRHLTIARSAPAEPPSAPSVSAATSAPAVSAQVPSTSVPAHG